MHRPYHIQGWSLAALIARPCIQGWYSLRSLPAHASQAPRVYNSACHKLKPGIAADAIPHLFLSGKI
jgi:hypothetical protein